MCIGISIGYPSCPYNRFEGKLHLAKVSCIEIKTGVSSANPPEYRNTFEKFSLSIA